MHFSPYLHTPSSPDFSNSGNIRKHIFHSHKHTKYASFTAFLRSLHRDLKCSNRHTHSIRVQSTAGSFSTLCSKLTENLNNSPQIYHIFQCFQNMLTWLGNMETRNTESLKYLWKNQLCSGVTLKTKTTVSSKLFPYIWKDMVMSQLLLNFRNWSDWRNLDDLDVVTENVLPEYYHPCLFLTQEK